MNNHELNWLSKEILDASITVHRQMGPGLLESVYEECLIEELKLRKIHTLEQVGIPLIYKGKELKQGFKRFVNNF